MLKRLADVRQTYKQDSLAGATFRTRAVFSARTCRLFIFHRKFAGKKIIKFSKRAFHGGFVPFLSQKGSNCSFVFQWSNSFGTYFSYAQTCDNVCVQSATQSTASVHTLHMPKPVITFVFKVLRSPLLLYILYTCPNL